MFGYAVNENGLNVHELKRCPAYAPQRGGPRFEALLNLDSAVESLVFHGKC